MRTTAIITAGILSFAAGTLLAQSQLNRSQEREVLGLLEEAGLPCERISRTQTVGELPNRDSLMAVACTSGEQYVFLMDRRANMTFYSTCEALAEANNNQVRCFR